MNYLEELINSKNILFYKDISTFKVSGLYILCPEFQLEKITGQTYLKVGITNEKEGLYGRLKSHFSGSTIKKDINSEKLRGGTTLHRHMYHDKTLGEEFGFNFSIPHERKQFLRENCFFKVLPLNEFNWTENREEKQNRFNRLHKIEIRIENILRDKIRYIDSVPLFDY